MIPDYNQYKEHLEILRTAALRSVDPSSAVRRSFAENDCAGSRNIFLIGAGKAAAAMTQAAADILRDRDIAGVVSAPLPPGHPVPGIEYFQGGHPLPNAQSVSAGRAVERLLRRTTPEDLVIALVSGGGSAMLELPEKGLRLSAIQQTTAGMLKNGAPIQDINSLRMRLSRIKGGGLLHLAAPARLLGLILSDVVGNPLEKIASGPTVPWRESSREMERIIIAYRLQETLPASVLQMISRERETADGFQAGGQAVENRLIASNRQAGEAALLAAGELGFYTAYLGDEWQGEAREMGKQFADRILQTQCERPSCFTAGGESTVIVRGKGMGGRNLEAAWGAAHAMDGREGVALAFFATDGKDGPTDAAGAVVTGETMKRARGLQLDPQVYLADNNTLPFFSALDDLIFTGPTGTNVNDLMIGLIYRQR